MDMADGNEAWASANTFFFEQTVYKRPTKRFKKQPDDLPQELRFAHLNPRVAAYLANKEKEKVEELDEIVNKKSLLPQITETVNLIRHQLNSTLSNDENSQRFILEQAKLGALALLPLLGKVLNLYQSYRQDKRRNVSVTLPRSLEFQLLSTHRELTADVHIVPREWQLPSNREEYLAKMLSREQMEKSDADSIRDMTTPLGSTSNASGVGSRSGGDQDDTRSVRSAKSNKSLKDNINEAGATPGPTSLKVPTKGGTQPRPKAATGRNSQLSDILEHDEVRSASRLELMPTILQGKKAESREKVTPSTRPKTRLEKFKTNSSSIDQRGKYHKTERKGKQL